MTENWQHRLAGALICLAVTMAGCSGLGGVFSDRRRFAPEASVTAARTDTDKARPGSAGGDANGNGNVSAGGIDGLQARQANQAVADWIERARAHEQTTQQNSSADSATAYRYERDASSIAMRLRSTQRANDEPLAPVVIPNVTDKDDDTVQAGSFGQGTAVIDRDDDPFGILTSRAEQPEESVKPESLEPKITITAIRSRDPVKPTERKDPGSAEPLGKQAPTSQPVSDAASSGHSSNKTTKLPVTVLDAGPGMSELINQLKRKINDRPQDRGSQVKLKLLYAILGQWELALSDKTDQPSTSTSRKLAESVAKLVQVFDNPLLSSSAQASAALGPIGELHKLLKQEADLKIADLQLCLVVEGYSDYRLVPDGYFRPDRARPVIVYIELDNFASVYVEKRRKYKTSLGLTIRLIDKQGKVRQSWHHEPIEDFARKHRRDFFHAQPVNLPAMNASEYKLKITVDDLVGDKTTSKILDIAISPEK